MKVETARVPVEGLTIELDEPASIMDYDTEDFRFTHPVHVRVTIHQVQRKLYVTGSLSAVASMCCGCCCVWPPR